MPRLPRISGQEAIRVLERMGFRQTRQRGSHVILRRGERGCAIPLHRDLAIGTLHGALRQAGVSADEFVEAFRGR
jgi:predicted RNA binding protein YcfA (HicA-like mRNA interferase family)